MKDPPTTLTAAGRVRAVIIYRHPLLRDVTVRVLSTAGVAVVGAMRLEELMPEIMGQAQPDVIIVDQAVGPLPDGLTWATLLSPERHSATRVITIGLESTTMVVCSKQLVPDASAQNLIEAVFGILPDELLGSSRESA